METCRHFGVCGGCSSQDIPYADQLKEKQQKVAELFLALNPEEVSPLIPSPELFYYRNKMEFAFDMKSDPPKLGLRMRKRFDRIINVEECRIFSPAAGKILGAAREWVCGLDPSFPRFMVVRESKKTGALMINLVFRATRYVFENKIRAKCVELGRILTERGLKLECLSAGVNRGKAEVASVEENIRIMGEDHIEETLGNLRFRIFPYTFFQTNTLGAEVLYDTVRALISPQAGSTCLDVYCGAGCIGLWVSPLFEKVIGVEQNPLSVENAKINAELNGISACEFVPERAEIFLGCLAASKFHVKLSTVITDPPRPGIADRALKAILELNPPEIIYVSCKPETMSDDLKKTVQLYKIKKIQPVDMFPHTPHVEIAAKLVHK
jgi:23S rRNA (uracil-5-)-methyltransferase RumA